ncbi:hydrolase [Liquorilactobacillus sucicola DSM 21376 = JCM 15457]|uniref:HAD superfamily hydrolase n=1 Tax=Liquorilactobacillus sucicola DSM 21376 = JCM 15457 TaxID=1423806 RepID=A0A023CW71_9LACO|nr:Cof-type HAD-IIB family hydrolase [Liquorilactobacillus sucicola]KRN06188.1 HAD superfamily hydrolase [Liquorilactobacillus sucicola DSM 21376 = JCM 15457]GAJ26117.1 hydrolase [Liquorilactobacillus sucicola DSM 21376 = JCM 15457]
MQQKLIALDLDGTTLNEQSVISEKTKRILRKASQAGHIVSIVTGRPYRISKHIYDDLNIKTPMINFNGGLGHIPHQTWDKEYQKTFSREIAFDLLKNMKTFGIKLMAAEKKSMMLANNPHALVDDFFPVPLNSSQILNQQNLKTDPTSLTMLVDDQKKDAIIRHLDQVYGSSVEVGVWGGINPILELEPKGVNKAEGIKYLADNYKIDRSNIIAFGDEHNDREMIDYAGWGVVMSNGTADLKGIANDITAKDNTQDGLADYLADYLKLAE